MITQRATVLTNATDAYLAVAASDNASSSRDLAPDDTIGTDRDAFWDDLSRSVPAPPTLALQSLDVREYGHAPALVLVYTAERFMGHGPFVYTVVRFFSDTSTVTFVRVATRENPANGHDGLDAIARSFRFGD